MSNNYKRTDSIEFTKKVSRKIKGWYSNDTFHDKAVNRIALQREEIISLFAYSGDSRSPIPMISVHSVGDLLYRRQS